MRTLIITRGAPGSGKSTFIEKMGWKKYTLCPDEIRLMMQSPELLNEDGKFGISQKNDKEVWRLLLDILEKRMQHGDFTVIDATHSKSQELRRYKDLIKTYRYRLFCIDFTDVPIETCKEQNKMRPEWKQVPEDVIENIYSRFSSQELQSFCKVISHNDIESIKSIITERPSLDVSKYNKVYFIGDIHGCFTPFKQWLDEHPFSDDALYVFIGDYIDRGLENDKIIEWLLENYKKENVMLLQGNHEKWLQMYANEEVESIRSTEFKENTMPQLERFSKKDLRELCRRLIVYADLQYGDERYIVTHSGIGFLPDSMSYVSATEVIKSNKYEEDCDEQFERHLKNDKVFQVHGHRNTQKHEVCAAPHSFNLCEEVEWGGSLRILEVSKDG